MSPSKVFFIFSNKMFPLVIQFSSDCWFLLAAGQLPFHKLQGQNILLQNAKVMYTIKIYFIYHVTSKKNSEHLNRNFPNSQVFIQLQFLPSFLLDFLKSDVCFQQRKNGIPNTTWFPFSGNGYHDIGIKPKICRGKVQCHMTVRSLYRFAASAKKWLQPFYLNTAE